MKGFQKGHKINLGRTLLINGQKICPRCKINLSKDNFRIRPKSGYLESYCRPCERDDSKKRGQEKRKKFFGYWRVGNRTRNLQKKYGLTLEQYNNLKEKQNGVCAICFKENQRRILGVDHCHKTGIIRGLLCDTCNVALGMFKDDPQRLLYAAIYLAGNKIQKYAN